MSVQPTEPSPEAVEANKLWQEYLQKCCEYGQLTHALEQLDSQRRQIEKNVEVTMRAVKSAADKHRENQSKSLNGQTPKSEVVPTETAPGSH